MNRPETTSMAEEAEKPEAVGSQEIKNPGTQE